LTYKEGESRPGEKFHSLYYSRKIIRGSSKEDDDGAYVKEMRIAYKILERKFEGKRSFGRSRRRRKEDIRI
jgi:hypothetical protein